MRLTSFKVQGFKNLVAPVEIAGLGPINVIHGANNVGKSNLMQAIDVFFRVLALAPDLLLPGKEGKEGLREIGEPWLLKKGIHLADIFNYGTASTIDMTTSLTVDEAELASAGMHAAPESEAEHISLQISLESRDHMCGMALPSFRIADGANIIGAAAGTPNAELLRFAQRLTRILVSRFLGPRGAPYVGVERHADAAVNALYDASVSQDRKQAMQWDRFVQVMATFRDILGDGRFVAVLPRGAPDAQLLYETPSMRIPLRALGSGVQQIVALFGHILTAGASIVLVEEPELNLKWALQERVRDALRELVGKEGAPSQLFITSHSGAFETRDTFYFMRSGPKGPVVELRPVSDVPLVVGGGAPEAPVSASRAPAYVSGEGTLRLPERIQKAVGVEHGGGVSFVDKGDGVVEMMSDDTLLRLAGIHDDA